MSDNMVPPAYIAEAYKVMAGSRQWPFALPAPLLPPSRRERLRRRVRWAVSATRERAALRIAPWLEPGDY